MYLSAALGAVLGALGTYATDRLRRQTESRPYTLNLRWIAVDPVAITTAEEGGSR